MYPPITFSGIFYEAQTSTHNVQPLQYMPPKRHNAPYQIEQIEPKGRPVRSNTVKSELKPNTSGTPLALASAILDAIVKEQNTRGIYLRDDILWNLVASLEIPKDEEERQLILSGNDLEVYQNLPDDTAKDKYLLDLAQAFETYCDDKNLYY